MCLGATPEGVTAGTALRRFRSRDGRVEMSLILIEGRKTAYCLLCLLQCLSYVPQQRSMTLWLDHIADG